jgi:hypothetical protein
VDKGTLTRGEDEKQSIARHAQYELSSQAPKDAAMLEKRETSYDGKNGDRDIEMLNNVNWEGIVDSNSAMAERNNENKND